MKKLYGVLLSLLFIAMGCEGAGGVSTPTMPSLFLSESELNRLSLDAMGGSVEATEQLIHYYWSIPYYGSKRSTLIEWVLIGAENGSGEDQETTAIFLTQQGLSMNRVFEVPRALFWLRLACRNGVERLRVSLEGAGIALDFDFPPDSSFPDSYTDMSAGMVVACEEGALQGSGKAALLLAKYYHYTVKDGNLSAYWCRIGAQNGDPECQYNLAYIYIGIYDELHFTRGDFWRDKAVENGFLGPKWE